MKFSSGKALADGLVDVIKGHVAAEWRRHVEETERRGATRIQE